MAYADLIAEKIQVRPQQVEAAISLLEDGNTIPFIARYRKEATGLLDEEQLRQIQDWLEKLKAIDERRKTILATIGEQGKLTEDLKEQIHQAQTLTQLEDLYQPYKPKRRTRAMIARENGLESLATLILSQPKGNVDLAGVAGKYLNEKIDHHELALQGARDILAEMISDHPEVRSQLRAKAWQWGSLLCDKIEKAEDPKRVYELYYSFESRIERLRPHQVLAINRGEAENILRVKVQIDERDWRGVIGSFFRPDPKSGCAGQLELAIEDAAERLLLPAIERDIRRQLTEAAWSHALKVFQANLRALLLQPPLKGKTILGIDPGFRTGCKLAAVDPTGKVLTTGTIYPHEPQKQWNESLRELKHWVQKYHINLITIGNGTASRETEQLVVALIREVEGVYYLIVNEAGASVYSASPLAREELPGLDVSLRGAVSIARRAQDALAELVKIDPKSIGVGMYQHDVDQGELGRALHAVVENVVNQVGVDVNTASPALLTYVSGIGPRLAEKIVAYRNEHGAFQSRNELKKVPGLGEKAFEQAAGFLRIHGGSERLDASAIHPESYQAAKAVLTLAGVSQDTDLGQIKTALHGLLQQYSMDAIAERIGIGSFTLNDIVEQLLRPGRDPREDLPAPILRSDVLSMEDLRSGMRMKGTVRNVVDFGAFIDIGVKQDGLLHRSQIPHTLTLQTGAIIDVEVIQVDVERGRISLSWAGDKA
uniref:RNA-binding transcriptional accessory protein n=1 Tax=Anaerolinea thermolimosa TaxID=229919 RepID=A0A7C4PJT0_9CHLR